MTVISLQLNLLRLKEESDVARAELASTLEIERKNKAEEVAILSQQLLELKGACTTNP